MKLQRGARLYPFLFAVHLLLLCAAPTSAVEWSGQYSNLLFMTRDLTRQERVTDLNRLRLKLDHDAGPFALQIAYDHELLWGGMVADPRLAAALAHPDPTWIDATADLVQRSHLNWRHTLYRGWMRYEHGPLVVKLGRQRIAWGSGRIWNPTDRFNPVQPTALEPDQKLGVDAVRVAWNYGDFGSVVVVAAPPRPAYATARKMALRWQDTFGEFDLALTAARIGAEQMLGLDITGNLGDAGGRFEWMQSDGAAASGFGQIATGLDYTWQSNLFPNGLYMALEYFYNSAAAQPGGDRLNSRSHHLLGGMLGYDLTALWRFDLLAIADLQYGGAFIAPSLKWSVHDDTELTLIAQLPEGKGLSEFAGFEPLWALRLDYYF